MNFLRGLGFKLGWLDFLGFDFILFALFLEVTDTVPWDLVDHRFPDNFTIQSIRLHRVALAFNYICKTRIEVTKNYSALHLTVAALLFIWYIRFGSLLLLNDVRLVHMISEFVHSLF